MCQDNKRQQEYTQEKPSIKWPGKNDEDQLKKVIIKMAV